MKNDKIKDQEVTAEQVAEAVSVQPVAGETFYTLEEIQAQPSAFGVMPEVLAGALATTDEEKLTRTQVQSAIEAFKKRKV